MNEYQEYIETPTNMGDGSWIVNYVDPCNGGRGSMRIHTTPDATIASVYGKVGDYVSQLANLCVLVHGKGSVEMPGTYRDIITGRPIHHDIDGPPPTLSPSTDITLADVGGTGNVLGPNERQLQGGAVTYGVVGGYDGNNIVATPVNRVTNLAIGGVVWMVIKRGGLVLLRIAMDEGSEKIAAYLRGKRGVYVQYETSRGYGAGRRKIVRGKYDHIGSRGGADAIGGDEWWKWLPFV